MGAGVQLHTVQQRWVEVHLILRLPDAQQAAVPPRLLVCHCCCIQHWVLCRGPRMQPHKQRRIDSRKVCSHGGVGGCLLALLPPLLLV